MILSLKRRLEAWVQHGVISQEEADRILSHETATTGRPWAMFGIVGIGVVTVATGIVSLISANWAEIPGWCKILCYLLLHSGVGALFLRFERRPSAWREGFLLLFSLLFFAGIGLFAQVFHLSGPSWRPLVFWLVLAFPLTLVARNYFSHHGWVLLFGITCAHLLWAQEFTLTDQVRAVLFSTVPVFLYACGMWGQQLKTFPEGLRVATIVWGLGSVLIVGSALGNTGWLISHRRPLEAETLPYLVYPLIAVAIAVVGSMTRPRVSKSVRSLVAGILLFTTAFVLIPLVVGIRDTGIAELPRQIIGATGFVLIWALAAAAAALSHYRRLFDIASCCIAGRFIGVYFEVFGSLATTGIGLIISGLVILAIAGAWYRYRGVMVQKLGGLR